MALPIHKGIASVDSLEGGLGNMRAADRMVFGGVAQKIQRFLSADIERDNIGSFEESPHGLSSTSERLVLIWAFLLLPPHPEESGRHPVRFLATLYRFAHDLDFAQVALPAAPIP